MRKRAGLWLILTMGVMMAGAASGCGSSEAVKPITSAGEAKSGSTEAATETESVTEKEESSSGASTEAKASDSTAGDTKIEPQVLLDAENVKVTAQQYVQDDVWGDGLRLLIENNGKSDVGVGSHATIVNDYMITDLLSAEVAAGKKSNETMYLSSKELEASGIDNIGQIESYLYLFSPDTYETIYTADPVTIKTNKFDEMDMTPNDDGQELYNEGGIRIVGKYVDENDFWGNAVVLYLENKTKKNVTFQCDDMSVNGYMVTPFFSCDVYAGKMAVSDITLMEDELKQNGIESVDDVELKFNIIDSDSYETIRTTDPIKFSTK